MSLTYGECFAGIGGISLGFDRAGLDGPKWFIEKDEFCQQVLKKHWPDVPIFGDIKEVTGDELEPVDLITGGFPCQPVSLVGRGLAQSDDRWLWPELARLIGALRPRYAVMENVPGLLVRGFGDVLGDLADLGYDTEWDCIPAAAVGAPHLRYRVFVVAYSDGERLRGIGPERLASETREGEGEGSQRQRLRSDAESESAGSRTEDGANADSGRRQEFGQSDRSTGSLDRPRGHDTDGLRSHVPDAERDGLEGHQQAGTAPRSTRGSGEVADADRQVGRATRGPSKEVFRPESIKRLGRRGSSAWEQWAVEPDVRGVAPRVSEGLDGGVDACSRLGAYSDSEASALEALLDLWCQQQAARPASQGWRSDEQLRQELVDALCVVSHKVALGAGQNDSKIVAEFVFRLREACRAAGAVQHASHSTEATWQSLPEEDQGWVILALSGGNWVAEWPGVQRVSTGVKKRTDRLRSLGNSVVPQVAEYIGGLILDHAARTDRSAA